LRMLRKNSNNVEKRLKNTRPVILADIQTQLHTERQTDEDRMADSEELPTLTCAHTETQT